jgi:hypothetical protein
MLVFDRQGELGGNRGRQAAWKGAFRNVPYYYCLEAFASDASRQCRREMRVAVYYDTVFVVFPITMLPIFHEMRVFVR